MSFTLGFDVYGTLIDPHGVVVQLERMIGERAPAFSQLWRDKQLEYTWRRGLMQQYRDFGVCTRDALAYALAVTGESLSQEQQDELVGAYATLPAYAEATPGLEALANAGHALYAFSNGHGDAVHTVLANAGIRDFFQGVVSVDEVQTFKPSPRTYEHFMARTGSNSDTAWLVSSNGFDVIGAVATGMRAAWIQRSPAIVFDPWEFRPTVILDSLEQLPATLVESGQ